VGQKSHDPCFHKRYIESGVITFVSYWSYFDIVASCTMTSADGAVSLSRLAMNDYLFIQLVDDFE